MKQPAPAKQCKFAASQLTVRAYAADYMVVTTSPRASHQCERLASTCAYYLSSDWRFAAKVARALIFAK